MIVIVVLFCYTSHNDFNIMLTVSELLLEDQAVNHTVSNHHKS